MMVRREEPVQPGEVVHGYRIERKLGQGGFGQVYLGWQEGRPYALKFVDMKEAEVWAKRELSILLHLQHANVVRLVGHMRRDGYFVLVMEYVPGRTLYQWVGEENPPARDVARVVARWCRALAAVHAAGVKHRDLKGDNVLVRDADGEPVLVDFGVSDAPWAPQVTPGGIAPGALAYRSPEWVRFLLDPKRPRGERYPFAVTDDLYAMGVTLYVLLTDVYPFEGGDELELMREIVREAPVAPHERNRRVPRALSELCLRLLEKEPSTRFQSADEVAEALEKLLAEADASWDMPLCYGWDEAGRTTARVPELAGPLKPWDFPRVVPRRGRKPAPVEEPPPPAAALVPVPVAPASALVPVVVAAPERSSGAVTRSGLLRAGGVLGLVVLGLGGGHLLLSLSPSAPPRADTPESVVMVATRSKGETRLKKREHEAIETQQAKGLGRELARWCVGAAAAANAACAGAQVRPQPEPQPCPAEALEVMTRRFPRARGLELQGVSLPGRRYDETRIKPIPVREGPVTIFLGTPWGELPDDTYLSGHFVFGSERVYGRFTEALLPSGETVKVCFALVEGGLERRQGLPIEGTGEPGTVMVFPLGRLRAVDRFE